MLAFPAAAAIVGTTAGEGGEPNRSPAVEAEVYLLSCGRYIERNPLAARLVAVPWAYRWSSCRAYALGEADGLLSPNPWYEALSPEVARRQELWRAFLVGEDAKEAE